MEDSKSMTTFLLGLDSIVRASVIKKFSMCTTASERDAKTIEKFYKKIVDNALIGTENVFRSTLPHTPIRYYFTGTPAEVIEKMMKHIENMVSLPDLTLTKMLYNRLLKLEEKLKLHDRILRELSNIPSSHDPLKLYEKFFNKYGKDFSFRSIDIDDVPDFYELSCILTDVSTIFSTTSTTNLITDIKGLCRRKEMTTEIISSAVKQLGVNAVMSC